ncbi:MAG: hypothetical protein JST58_07400 [Bacteroidetes bacterium]|nr:hypothetical protein [Bacteroidota bacterium]
MQYRRLLILFFFVCDLIVANAQRPVAKSPLSNLHKKFIQVRKNAVQIDSLSIIPKTFSIIGISDSAYSIDYVNATLVWKRKLNLDSVLATYRTFPYKLNSVAKRLNYDSVEGFFLVAPSTFKDDKYTKDNFFNFGNITYNGSFGRSLTFGNNQDAVVNSNLNLQLSGYLADSIQISAALTDNNIPIQPDGSTAQISDFDKIFLQFKKKNWALSMGDIDLRQNQNYYLSFYKRVQGATFETKEQLSKNISNKTILSGAIAKGKFNRNIFQGLEGNQGPYRLVGANNELYFVVLAGTEKVYINGQLMQRGADQDYIINYNTAEVTFMPRQMITQDSRIQVEFEYSSQNYLNSNLYLANETDFSDKLKLRFAVFNNSDARNSPISQSLDANQKRFLFGIGDSVNNAFYPVAPIDTLSAGKVLYEKVDTTYIAANGFVVNDSIYRYSTNPNVILYNLSFVDLGPGKGNYVPNLNGVNGNVYTWVAPVNGQKQGRYEAAQFLVTPKTQRVITLGADYALNKHTSIITDLAYSHYDVNTLSTLGKSMDDGYAARVQLKNVHPFAGSRKGLELKTNLSFEQAQASFTPIEPIRALEFLRDWGLALQPQAQNELLYSSSFELMDKKKNFVKYQFDGYDRGSSFHGIRNTVLSGGEIKDWHIMDGLSVTSSSSDTANGLYLKPNITVFKKFSQLANYTLGSSYNLESNTLKNRLTDTLSTTSFAFQQFQVYLKSPEQKPNHWGLNFTQRENYYPYGKNMIKGDRANSLNLTAQFLKSKHEQFRLNATYRELQILDSNVNAQRADKSLVGRLEYLVNEWKGLLTGNAFYEVGSGQEQQKTYSFLQVPAGTGQYEWIDANHDGIQQLNEFVIAQFTDQANFIKIFTPTNNYVKANYNTLNYSFSINPKMLIDLRKSTGFMNILARTSFQSSLQLTQKEQAKGFVQLNPFKKTGLDDTTLITKSIIFSNTLSFNKTSTKWGFDINHAQNAGKTLLTYGYESRSLSEWTLRARLNLSRSIVFNTTLKQGINLLSSSNRDIDSSNYKLMQYSMEPSLTYTHKSNLRMMIGYNMSNKTNAFELGGQQFSSGSVNSELKYNILQNTSMLAKFTYTNITFAGKNGTVNFSSPVAYTILNGLLPGKNYLWSLDITKKLGGSLELGLQYEGRKPSQGPVINTGRASLRAIL